MGCPEVNHQIGGPEINHQIGGPIITHQIGGPKIHHQAGGPEINQSLRRWPRDDISPSEYTSRHADGPEMGYLRVHTDQIPVVFYL